MTSNQHSVISIQQNPFTAKDAKIAKIVKKRKTKTFSKFFVHSFSSAFFASFAVKLLLSAECRVLHVNLKTWNNSTYTS